MTPIDFGPAFNIVGNPTISLRNGGFCRVVLPTTGGASLEVPDGNHRHCATLQALLAQEGILVEELDPRPTPEQLAGR